MPPPKRRSGIWASVRRLLGLRPEPPPPPPEPPDEEPALVPSGPPRSPRPAGSIELEIPEESSDVDARGGPPE